MEIIASIDPVTRLEGHLRIQVTIDTVGGAQQVVDVKATGNLFRGFEQLLVGRDPRDAQHITERICGVCPVAHGMTAVKAQDNAFGVTVPDNARIMRNLVNGANFVESHILHFYHLAALDFVQGPAMPPWTPNWGGDRRISAGQNDGLVAHYVAAIAMRRKAHEMGALFGGRIPHPPAYISGGFTATPRPERILAFTAYLNELITFITNVYLPDVEVVAAKYPDYFTIGRGHANLLSFGVFDLDNVDVMKLLMPGFTAGGSRSIQPLDQTQITQHVTYSWFDDNANDQHPALSATTSPVNPKRDAYSWVKAPRYNEVPCEVGPLARMWVTGDYRNGISVMDRHRARAQEALKIAQAMLTWVAQLNPSGPVYTEPVRPANTTGYALTEAPRGALGHWMSIQNKRTSHYEVISPTTWNCGPRDGNGQNGPLEEALLGVPVENADEPIEVLRVIHSFDPCLDCATHVMRPNKGAKIFAIKHTHGEEHDHGHSHGAHGHHHEH